LPLGAWSPALTSSLLPRTTTRHVLITAANVFEEYPPSDMN
jgi:hypothetical protein